MTHVLALDQSTSATKALLFDLQGRVVGRVSRPHQQHYPQPGWVEHDAEEIFQNTKAALAELCALYPEETANALCLSLTNQRETIVVFDTATGQPLHPAIVWQCRRGAAVCTEMADEADRVCAITGLPLDTYFPAPKLKQLWRDRPELAARVHDGSARIGTIDTYLLYRLTGGSVFATDHTNASRTLLYDLQCREWSGVLCDLFQVPRDALPEIRDCNAVYGETDAGGILPRSLPIAGVIGDSQAALFGQRCFAPGSAKATLGTGSSILMNVGFNPQPATGGMVSALAWVTDGTAAYAREGIINYAGATLHWLRDQLGLLSNLTECEALAQSVQSSEGVYLVPAFVGMGAPYWQPEARAAILGLTPGSTRAHVARAALESIALQIADVLQAMSQASGQPLCGLNIDGGMSANRFLIQTVADITGQRLRVSAQSELSAAGAAMMGLLGMGQQTLDTLLALPIEGIEYYPCPERATEAQAARTGWHAAVQAVLQTAARR